MDIDQICGQTTNPQMLNALHACRPNHPLNHPYQWRNAHALAAQRPSYEISSASFEWLAKKASEEAD